MPNQRRFYEITNDVRRIVCFFSNDVGTLTEEILTLYTKIIQLRYRFFAFRQYCIFAASLQTHFAKKHLIVPLKIIRHMSSEAVNPNSKHQKSKETGETQLTSDVNPDHNVELFGLPNQWWIIKLS